MKELDYCISIVNLFEDEDIDNSSLINILLENRYHILAKELDIKKEEKGKPPKNYMKGYSCAFKDKYYEHLLHKAMNLLQENISKNRVFYRYGYSFLDYIDRISSLFRTKGLDEKQMLHFIEKINNPIGKKHLFMELLEYMKNNKKWNEMEYYIQKMPIYYASESSYLESDKHTSKYGYRIKIYEYIENINLKLFLKEYKKCKPMYDKYQMVRIKDDFMFAYSKKYGHSKAIELTKKTPFKNYEYMALFPFTKNNSFSKMKTIIKKYPEIYTSKKYLKEQLLVATLENQFDQGVNVDKSIIFLIHEIKLIDRKIRFGDLKLKDSLLCDLGQCTRDIELITVCRKLIGYNLLKQELKLWVEQIQNNSKNE